MRWIPTVLQGRWSWPDVVDALRRRAESPSLAEREPDPFKAVTPLELLAANLRHRGLELVDYRDWPRRRTYDWREYGWPGDKSRAAPYGGRRWSQISAVCLHTYGVEGMVARRFLGVPTHFGVATYGDVVLCHPMTKLVAASNGANRFSVAIEISGVSGFDCRAQVESGRALLRYIVAEHKRHTTTGKPLAIMGHSMATRRKPLCPGEEIMRELGAWGVDELGLRRGPVLRRGIYPPQRWWQRAANA